MLAKKTATCVIDTRAVFSFSVNWIDRCDSARHEPVDGDDDAGAAPTPSLSESFNCLPGLNFADLLAAISIDSPVFGLRPVRACRSDTENVPKPEMFTRSPWRSAAMTSSSTMLIARSASALLRGSLFDNASMSSALVICNLRQSRSFRDRIFEPRASGSSPEVAVSPAQNLRQVRRYTRIVFVSGRHRDLRFRLAQEREVAVALARLEERIRVGQHQRMLEHFVHVLDLDQGDALHDLRRDLLDVLGVVLGHQDRLDAAAMRREHLLLESADRQHPPAQRDFA